MSNIIEKRYDSNIIDKTMNINLSQRSELLSQRNTRFENSFVPSRTNLNSFNGLLSRQSSVNSHINNVFKAPNIENISLRKSSVASVKSPAKKLQLGKLKSDIKGNGSHIPRPSFINSRKSFHSSRATQLNARKELIKKMVFLAECTLKENREPKQSTPKSVKVLAGMTPKKTPRSGGYFFLPEFNKKVPKLEEIRSPIQDLIKKEMFGYSKRSPGAMKTKKPETGEEEAKAKLREKSVPSEAQSTPERFLAILHHCKNYSKEVNCIHGKLRDLDETFEGKLKNVPDYKVYNEFCFYQSKKEDLYKEMQAVEAELRNFVASHAKVGAKLEAYVKKKGEFFEKQLKLHREFERAVSAAIEKSMPVSVFQEEDEEGMKTERNKKETPKLRRSLRLSKIRKSKFEERTPMSRKLKKLDAKSKGIQRVSTAFKTLRSPLL